MDGPSWSSCDCFYPLYGDQDSLLECVFMYFWDGIQILRERVESLFLIRGVTMPDQATDVTCTLDWWFRVVLAPASWDLGPAPLSRFFRLVVSCRASSRLLHLYLVVIVSSLLTPEPSLSTHNSLWLWPRAVTPPALPEEELLALPSTSDCLPASRFGTLATTTTTSPTSSP